LAVIAAEHCFAGDRVVRDWHNNVEVGASNNYDFGTNRGHGHA
jgi:hypothetical protein